MFENWKEFYKYQKDTLKILPTVYEDSLSYYELISKLFKFIEDFSDNIDNIRDVVEKFIEEYDLMHNDKIKEYLDKLIETGQLQNMLTDLQNSSILEIQKNLATGLENLDLLDKEHQEVTAQLAQSTKGSKPAWSVWEEFEQRRVNVKWFGAKGDGITDDAVFIQQALDSMINGGTLYFPDGNYVKSGSIIISKSNIKVEFSPNAKITEKVKGFPAFKVANGIKNITFKGVNAYGVNDDISPASYAIFCDSLSSELVFDGCLFDGYTGGIILNDKNFNVTIQNCKFYNMIFVPEVGAGGYGIVFQGSYYVRVANNYFDGTVERHQLYLSQSPTDDSWQAHTYTISGNTFLGENKDTYKTGFEYLIKVMGSADVTITGNNFRGGVGHVMVTVIRELRPRNVVISNNTFSHIKKGNSANHSSAIYLTAGQVENCIISDNVIHSCDVNNGIEINHGENIAITDNVMRYNTSIIYGIRVERYLRDSIISNNIINGVNRGVMLGLTYTEENKPSYDVFITKNVIKEAVSGIYTIGLQNGVIDGNDIDATLYGVFFYDSIPFDGEIKNNKIKNARSGITLNTETIEPVLVFNNIFRNIVVNTIVNKGNAFIIEPIKNGLISSSQLKRGAVKSYGTETPTTGTWNRGDWMENTNKQEIGTSPNKYMVDGWECLVGGTPGTWRERRVLTGN